jgi:hypothetical protein
MLARDRSGDGGERLRPCGAAAARMPARLLAGIYRIVDGRREARP